MTSELLKCKANPALASPSRVHGDCIQFWTADDLHGEAPFDDAELGESYVRDEDARGFGLIQVELWAEGAALPRAIVVSDSNL